ncbi:MAG: NADP oxidoreductase [Rhodocyclaceae bacterium]|nr:NADP oxidoreductase [Rhodocyclaceae bacterium]
MHTLGTELNPLRIAIVGSGPSGFYAAEELLKSSMAVSVDMIDRLPSPFGLVRSGVAPDHPKLKMPIVVFDKVAQMPGFSFHGNVTVGQDISVEALQKTHHAVIFTCGAQTDRKLGVPGEALAGSHTATEFVGWYNGHPDYRHLNFDLSQEVAVIIGQGNVAADVARALSKSVDELRTTDMAEHAIEALAKSRVREIHIIGRRGPAQAKFTNKELKELGELTGCSAEINSGGIVLNDESLVEIESKTNFIAAKNVEIMRSWTQNAATNGNKRIVFHFQQSPVKLVGTDRVQQIILEKNNLKGPAFDQQAYGTDEQEILNCGLVFRSIGYRGVPIPGVPFDEKKGTFPNSAGRINNARGLYTAGWIKRGPSGIIGTNRADALETVATLLGDLESLERDPKPGFSAHFSTLENSKVKVVSYQGWQRIDAEERRRGELKGKPREKITDIAEMLSIAS